MAFRKICGMKKSLTECNSCCMKVCNNTQFTTRLRCLCLLICVHRRVFVYTECCCLCQIWYWFYLVLMADIHLFSRSIFKMTQTLWGLLLFTFSWKYWKSGLLFAAVVQAKTVKHFLSQIIVYHDKTKHHITRTVKLKKEKKNTSAQKDFCNQGNVTVSHSLFPPLDAMVIAPPHQDRVFAQ